MTKVTVCSVSGVTDMSEGIVTILSLAKLAVKCA